MSGSSSTSPRARLLSLAGLVALGLLLWLAPDALAQSGNDLGRNVGDLLRGYATQIYGGIIAIVGLIFLVNRRLVELAVFVVMAVIVAWLVFSPDQIAAAARAIGRRVLG